jgi:arylsulfatase A-like enzyme
LRMAVLIDRACAAISSVGVRLVRNLNLGAWKPWADSALRPLLATGRKSAQMINHEFLDWLTRRREPDRPFLAFLNYFDAHAPYLPPERSVPRFGSTPETDTDYLLLNEFWSVIDKLKLAPRYRRLFQDSYDNCLGYLDERLDELFDSLERSGLLDRTLLIITADHGEELGDHGLFEHGESLYRPEIRVPLLIVPPAANPSSGVVKEIVSLRELPATIVDLVGLATGSPFPGGSLTRLWGSPTPREAPNDDPVERAISELAAPNPSLPSRGRSPAARGSLLSLAERDWVYIRNEGNGSEELFNQREDPRELFDRSGAATIRPVLEQFRRRIDQFKATASAADH